MKMNGKAQNVYLSANVTIPCTLYEHDSVNLNISVIGIRWFQRRSNSDKEDNVFEYNGGKQTQFRPGASISLSGLRKGNASLFLPSIQLQEAGEYRCEIIIPPIKVERTARVDVVGEREGTWSPVFHVYWMAHSWKSQPQITWKKVIPRTHSLIEDNAEYIYRTSIRNNGGMFNATTSLILHPILEDNGTIYQTWEGLLCLHDDFHDPAFICLG
uniref:Natural cytotoxicity triggering receptor 3 ligand 1-like n=1 Tax=Phascolarctos cinereus TaxID=38626 RepID=A0A6P5LR13_PHACI|nr:natural cytotoxicity triggering receptor 3 ligand 1-like [Phascolarctos cinereus]